MNSKLRELLYRSLDDELTPIEQTELNQALAESAELRAEHEQLLKLRGTLADHQPAFKPFFETRVMQRIAEEKASVGLGRLTEALSLRFKRLALAAAVGAVVLVSINLAGSDSLSVKSVFALDNNDQQSDLFVTPFEEVWE